MNSTVAELIAVLDQETILLKELVELLQGDHERIIKQDIPALEESNRTKEGVVLRFQALEASRMALTQRIGTGLGLSGDSLRISKICPLLDGDAARLETAAERLRALVGTFQELVSVGKGFLEQSILGIRGLLALIQSLRTSGPQTYCASGQLSQDDRSEALTVRREV